MCIRDRDDLVSYIVDWAKEFGGDAEKMQVADTDYLRSVLAIERDNPKRIRKDFVTWRQTLETVAFFWDALYVQNSEFEYNKDVLREFLNVYSPADDKDAWWAKMVAIAEKLGIKNGDVAMNLRVALSGRSFTPDLYSIISVIGADRVRARIGGILK